MEITLIDGNKCVIDAADEAYVVGVDWCVQGGYVRACVYKGRYALLHRTLLGARPGQHVDHINGDTLDNRRESLRICTHTQNMRNRRLGRDNTSGFKGVYQDQSRTKPWRARIRVGGGVRIRLGQYATPEEAHEAYKRAAIKYHGEFARFA